MQRRLDDREHVIAAVHTGPGGDDGFAVAVLTDGEGFVGRTLRVEDLHAADTGATAALWRFLLDVDLVASVEGWLRPVDEPVELLLADPRDCAVLGQEDETWLRLVVVPAAFACRSWADSASLLSAVHDPLLGHHAGVYRITDGTVERVGPLGGALEPELDCSVAGLTMAYLGDRAPSQLTATGW